MPKERDAPHPRGLSDLIIRDKSSFKQKDSYQWYIDQHPALHMQPEKGYFCHPFSNQKNLQKFMWIEDSILILEHIMSG